MSTLICWNNLFRAATYVVNAGTDSTASPISNCWNNRTARPALPTADSNGDLQITFTLSSTQIGYDVEPYGYNIYGGIFAADQFIIGASRHDPIGYRFTGGNVLLEAWDGAIWNTVLNEAMVYPQKSSVLFGLLEHDATDTYRLTISGQTASAVVKLPELFIGEGMNIGAVDRVFDKYADTVNYDSFTAKSGFEYDIIRFVQFIAKPKWSVISLDFEAQINSFREDIIEKRLPYWWTQDTDLAHKTYLMKHKTGLATFTTNDNVHGSFSLDAKEVL